MTFLKILADVRDGKGPQKGDVLNLVGNVSGIVMTATILLAGPPGVALFFGGLGILAGSANVLMAQGGLADWTSERLNAWWPSPPVIEMNDYWYDTEGRVRRYQDILSDPASGFSHIIINSASGEWEYTKRDEPPPPRPNEPEQVDGDGQL